MRVKLFSKMKASEMPDPGLLLPFGLQRPAFQDRGRWSGALGELWAPLLYACFKEGWCRPGPVTLAQDRPDKPWLWKWERKDACNLWAFQINPKTKPWVFFLRHFGICWRQLFWSPSTLWAYRCWRQRLPYTNDHFHIFQCSNENALFSSFSFKKAVKWSRLWPV